MKEYKSLLSLLKEEDAAAKAYNAFMKAYEGVMQDMESRRERYKNIGMEERFVEEQTEFANKCFKQAQEARQKLFAAKMAICAYFTTDELEGESNK